MGEELLVWEFYQDTQNGWRWRAVDFHNHKTLFVSSQGYVDRRDAEHCAKRAGWDPEAAPTEV